MRMDRNQADAIEGRVAAYCRVSTEEQKQKRNPIEAQKDVCQRICDDKFGRNGHDIILLSDEGMSGTLGPREDGDSGKHRPAYTRLLEMIAEGRANYVVTASLDRLGRDERDMAELRELLATHGVKVLTPGRVYDLNDPDDCVMFGIHAVIGAYQPRQTSAKSRAGKRQRAKRGLLKSNNAPFGWRLQEPGEYTDPRERTIVPVPQEGEVVARVAQLYLRGWGYVRIARYLKQQGAPSPGPRGWYGAIVRQILNCPVHAGLVKVDEGEYAQGKHFEHRHLDPETFHAIQREMQRRASVVSYPSGGSSFLVGALRCGHCGAPMTGKCGVRARYYRCSGDNFDPFASCPNVQRKAEHVEQVVINVLRDFALSDAVQAPVAEKVAEMMSADERSAREAADQIQGQLDKLRSEIAWLIEEAARRRELRKDFDERIEARQEKIAELQGELARRRSQQTDVEQRSQRWEEIRTILQDFDSIWSGLDAPERSRVVSIAFEELTLRSAEGGSVLRMKPFFAERQEVFIPAINRRDRPDHGLDALTHRECEVLHLLGEGLSVAEAAEEFSVPVGNIHGHTSRIRSKLRVRSNEEAVALSRQVVRARLPFLELEGRRKHDPQPEQLTDTELKLLPDLANPDLLYREIAAKHSIAEGTVKAHVYHMACKLRAKGGRKHVVDKARRLGLLSEG